MAERAAVGFWLLLLCWAQHVLQAAGGSEEPGRGRGRRQAGEIVEQQTRSHRLPCRWKEYKLTACLNGHCYALDLGGRQAFCHCPAEWEGPRCEIKSTYYYLTYYAEMKKFAIIAGVVIPLIIIIIAITVYCSYRKGKKKRGEAAKRKIEEENGVPKEEQKSAKEPLQNGSSIEESRV